MIFISAVAGGNGWVEEYMLITHDRMLYNKYLTLNYQLFTL